ncbi:hypothetical protein PV326_002107 [Microctonus aethiopoides]|nr:hypothetical protein PV326_002107 [Microctonus aethiopoides]
MDAYDTIKVYYRDGFPKNDLQAFVSICKDEASSGVFRQESDDINFKDLFDKFCCCRKRPYGSFIQSSNTSSSTQCGEECGGAICI